jgi:hypothetical protein
MKGLVVLLVLLITRVLSAQNSMETLSEPTSNLILPIEKSFWTEEGEDLQSIAAQGGYYDFSLEWVFSKKLEKSYSVPSHRKIILEERRLSEQRMKEEVCEHASLNWEEMSQSAMGPWQIAEVRLLLEPDSNYFQLETDAELKEVLLRSLSGQILRSWKGIQDDYWIGDMPKGAYQLEIGFKYYGPKRTWLCRL